jgi:hypothetical protein
MSVELENPANLALNAWALLAELVRTLRKVELFAAQYEAVNPGEMQMRMGVLVASGTLLTWVRALARDAEDRARAWSRTSP